MQLQQALPIVPQIPNVSLVAFYGDKPDPLIQLINNIQNYLTQLSAFTPYEIEQVHGTVLGCEGFRTSEGIVSQWFYLRRKEIRYLDCDNWLKYLQNGSFLPLNICFGDYKRDRDYNFLSRNQHPYYRSFQLQKVNNTTYIPVLIGWSKKDDLITLDLDNLRRYAQQFNLLHKYHDRADSIDNDFYLRLGTIHSPLSTDTIATVENQIREILTKIPAIELTISKNNLAFARYQDLSLTEATTTIIALAEITIEQLLQLY